MIADGRIASIAGLAFLGLAVAVFWASVPATPVAGAHPLWVELKWPFPIDQWGIGKAFHCGAKDCGRDVDVYLRAKIGFCNCATGIADDEELERVADFDLFGARPRAIAPGRMISVQKMAGRSRVYVLSESATEEKPALTIALNHKCDAVVATVVAGGNPIESESVALEFLSSDTIMRWLRAVLG
jgi:hypothetical protein